MQKPQQSSTSAVPILTSLSGKGRGKGEGKELDHLLLEGLQSCLLTFSCMLATTAEVLRLLRLLLLQESAELTK